MAPDVQVAVQSAQAWLQSSWSIRVPFAWLRACVEWLQEEAGGGTRLTQPQINKQVLDQWLLTDLRDLGHPVLPDGLSVAPKTELSGTFCVQVDSLLDVSQPAYAQLQKWKGTDCANETVSAVTQATQKPWEAKPTRMLLLQITDGIQSLEAMEYQPIPLLSTSLRPGAKLQLQGQMVCRLGVLLLGPSNVKLLGGEVEDMVARNDQGRVLCRALGLPEEEEQAVAEQVEEREALPAAQQGNEEVEDLELDDQELLASLEAQEQAEQARGWRLQGGRSLDSGYETLGTTASSRSSSVQGHRWDNQLEDSAVPSSSTSTTRYNAMDEDMADEDFPDEEFDDFPLDELDDIIFQESTNDSRQSDTSPGNAQQINKRRAAQTDTSNNQTPQTNQFYRTPQQQHLSGSGSRPSTVESRITGQGSGGHSSLGRLQRETMISKPLSGTGSGSDSPRGINRFATDDEIMDVDMDSCFPEMMEDSIGEPRLESTRNLIQGKHQNSRAYEIAGYSSHKTPMMSSSHLKPQVLGQSKVQSEGATFRSELTVRCTTPPVPSGNRPTGLSFRTEAAGEGSRAMPPGFGSHSRATEPNKVTVQEELGSQVGPSLSLTSPPFTYLSLLQDQTAEPCRRTQVIRVKAFIVTLLGKLTSSGGEWRVCATITDGSGYLNVELSDAVLTGLLGFSVVEKGVLKRDPARRAELETGMRRCQEELVDMCCLMTIRVEPHGGKAVVTSVDMFVEEDVLALEERVKERRK